MSIVENTASTWRDLIDDLMPEQVAELERWESRFPDEQKGLLIEARGYVEENLVSSVMFPHIGRPEQASGILGGWVEHDSTWSREFDGVTHDHGDFGVTLAGRQYDDGRLSFYARVYGSDKRQFTAVELRAAAHSLAEVADEIDRLR